MSGDDNCTRHALPRWPACSYSYTCYYAKDPSRPFPRGLGSSFTPMPVALTAKELRWPPPCGRKSGRLALAFNDRHSAGPESPRTPSPVTVRKSNKSPRLWFAIAPSPPLVRGPAPADKAPLLRDTREICGSHPLGANALRLKLRLRPRGDMLESISSGGRLAVSSTAARSCALSALAVPSDPAGSCDSLASKSRSTGSWSRPKRCAAAAAAASAAFARESSPTRFACALRNTVRSSVALIVCAERTAPTGQAFAPECKSRVALLGAVLGNGDCETGIDAVSSLWLGSTMLLSSTSVARLLSNSNSRIARGGWLMFHTSTCPKKPIRTPRSVHSTTDPSVDALTSAPR
eukprot:scaffold84722_cov27-Tisochrysis_lutea.AAC.1